MSQRDQIHQFIAELLAHKGDTSPFNDSDGLLTAGRIDSMDILELIGLLESRFNVDFAARGFDQNQLDSVEDIIALIST
jgi:acyl carrier protein